MTISHPISEKKAECKGRNCHQLPGMQLGCYLDNHVHLLIVLLRDKLHVLTLFSNGGRKYLGLGAIFSLKLLSLLRIQAE